MRRAPAGWQIGAIKLSVQWDTQALLDRRPRSGRVLLEDTATEGETMSIRSIWESRFPPERAGEGAEVTRAIWADMRSFSGYERHEIVQDIDDPGHLFVISAWADRAAADAALSYASHPNAVRANQLVSEPRRRTVAAVLDTGPR